jgi:hypothetical protein
MTTLRHGPIAQFVTHLKSRFNLSTLIETGTYEGDSTIYAAEIFDRVVTIDIRSDYQEETEARCSGHQNIEFKKGDTREVLGEIVASLDRPALFWLDAHAAAGLFGEQDDWPVLDELEIINRSPMMHYVLIDDAHCCLPQSPYPACPTFEDIQAKATEGGYACRICHDVIAMVPRSEAQELDYFESAV